MPPHDPSSLDRFLWGRGQDFLDSSGLRVEPPSPNQGLLMLAVAALLAVPAYVALDSGLGLFLMALSFVLSVCGVVALIQARNRRSRLRQGYWSTVGVSDDGLRLLHKLCGHIGYFNWQDEPRGRSLVSVTGYRTTAQVLPPALFDLMNVAASQFNRIEGLLRERLAASDSSLRNLAPNVRAAATEAMVVVLNHAAWIDIFPENAADHKATILARTAQLQEVADRLSQLAARQPTLTESLASRSLMDEVLDALRDEERARTEMTPFTEVEWPQC